MSEPEKIKNTFNKIAFRYDLANHLLSFGQDFLWRKKLVKLADPLSNQLVLDICCGTADLAIAFADYDENINICACDFSEEMLKIANKKTQKNNHKIHFAKHDCTNPDFPDNTFDIVSCAFGLRNIPQCQKAVSQAFRVLKPGGSMAILEFSMPNSRLIRPVYYFYLHYILPLIGGIITRSYTDYRYLADSVDKWDRQNHLPETMRKAGFENITEKNISLGIVKAYIGFKGNDNG